MMERSGDADERADAMIVIPIDEFMAEVIDLDPALNMTAPDYVKAVSGFCVFW